MKKAIFGLLILFVLTLALNACATHERCDAYKKPATHSRY